jgi:hypothetical protein
MPARIYRDVTIVIILLLSSGFFLKPCDNTKMANRDETSIKWIKPRFCRPLVLVVIDIGLLGYYHYLDLLTFSCSNCIVCASLSYGSCNILYQMGAEESSDRKD